jgi:pilus assembly protein CpaC
VVPASAASVPVPQATTAALVPLRGQTGGDESLGTSPQTFRSDPLIARPVEAEPSPQGLHPLPDDAVWLMAGSSQIYDFSYRLKRVAIANSKIADIEVVNPFQLNLIGHHPGFTTLTVWDQEGHYEQRQVRVDIGGKQQVLLNCVVAQLDRTKIENQGINLSAALKNTGWSLVGLPGLVATPYSPNTQLQVISPTNGVQTINVGATLPAGGSLIPMLLSPNLTYGVTGSTGQLNTQNLIQLLENHNMAKVLAEPDLIANSGEKAQFLSGGEIPIVIAQALNTSVVFKQYGTKVTFIPTVVGHNDIELEVEPEVSEPDYAHEVQLNGFMVPAFITRRAHTAVLLKDGQTLIIAGLNLNERHSDIQKVPYLGDVPILGEFFRNTSYQNNSSELVMTVTPQLVAPLPQNGQAYLPTSRGPMTPAEIETRRLEIPDVARPRF